MVNTIICTIFILLQVLPFYVQSQNKLTPVQYIEIYAPTAIKEMERSGIPASITLAQGLLESDNGNSPLAATANNHFGIKCHKEWTGDTYYQDDDEKNECFRYYQNAAQSYADHTDFLLTRSRYEFLFSYSCTDYVSWANGLKQAGYATNPQYPTLLVNLINRYDLSQYDLMKSKDMIEKETVVKNNVTINEPPTSPTPINIKHKPFDEGIVVETQAFFNEVFLLNNIKTVKAKKEDTPMGIATKYNVPISYLYHYNDMHEGELFMEGQNVFLQPKRNKGYAKQHIVKEGESMHEMSQAYGIKLIDLYKKNKVDVGSEIVPGQIITLREDNEEPPKSMSFEQFLENKKTSSGNKIPIVKKQETVIIEKTNTPTLSVEQIEKSIEKKTETKEVIIQDKPVVVSTGTQLIRDTETNYQEAPKTNTVIIAEKKQEPIATETISNIKQDSPKPILQHLVKQGDTLYNISKRYNVNVNDIILWNNIQANNIKLGQTLIVGK